MRLQAHIIRLTRRRQPDPSADEYWEIVPRARMFNSLMAGAMTAASQRCNDILLCLFTLLLGAHALASTVSVDPASVMHLTPQEWNPSNYNEAILDAVGTPDGIFASGWPEHDRAHVWAIKVSADGSLAWTSTYDAKEFESPKIARLARDGTYWVAGVTYKRDPSKNATGNPWTDFRGSVQHEYIRRFDRAGGSRELILISPIGDDHNFECGEEVPNGFILTGWTSSSSPWIEMIDKAGKRVWERSFAEQQDRLLENDIGGSYTPRHCMGLQAGSDGNLTWVTRVRTNYIISTPQGRQAVRRANSNGFWGIFLVQLDVRGNDIRRSFRPEVVQPVLLQDREGFSLMLQPHHQDQHPPANARLPDALGYQPGVDLGLTVEFLDQSLHETHSWNLKPDERGSQVETAFQTLEGGWLLATCDGTSGLKYLNSKGVLSNRISIDFDKSQQCDRVAIAEGTGPGKAVILAFNERAGVRTMIVNYAD
jgi:hypothetical protein